MNLLTTTLRQTTETPNRTTDMTRKHTSQLLKPVNFMVGFALLVMLFPHHGELPEKPAGVRTAIELIGKKTSVRVTTISEIASA